VPGNRNPYGVGKSEIQRSVYYISFSIGPGSYPSDHPPDPPQQPSPTIQPCTVNVPTEANDRAVLATLMGEAAYPGAALYTNATNNGRGNSSHDEAKHPERYAAWDDTYMEMEYMVSVFVNRQRDWGGSSWFDIATSKQKDGKTYQHEGYPNGLTRIGNLGAEGSGYCEQARTALKAIQSIKDIGPVNTSIHFWHGVLQEKNGPFVRVRNGAIRIGGSDFW
jgi:hypothetical protein